MERRQGSKLLSLYMEGKAWIIILGKTQHSHVGHENPIHMIRIGVLHVEVEGEERNH